MTGPPDAETDAELLAESVGSPERFAVLFDRHGDEIHRYVARRLGSGMAEDVVAETFLTAFRKRGRYDGTRPDARPWLYGIATRAVGAHRRAEVRRNRLAARAAERGDAGEGFEERSAERVSAERLQAPLALGVPVGTVRSRLGFRFIAVRDHAGAPAVKKGQVTGWGSLVAAGRVSGPGARS
ncbi:RNA polymerase sigma factor [Actinomadura sp. NTSP31]|uniref:RNA polymerase sigma factor n=1 Tax=Actinomadura sp. NTSP31 TaxID=1735447 RepID=UPI0035C05C4E